MKSIIDLLYKNIFLIFVFFVASFFRFYNLGKVPISMSDDEIREVMSAYAFIYTGKDLFGLFPPFSFNLDGFVYAPVPIYIVGIFIRIFDLSMWSSRVPYALSGIFSVLLVYLISHKILKNKYVSFFSSLLLSISAWHLQVSRFSHQGIFAMTFYLTGMYLLFFVRKEKYKYLLISMMFFMAGFYSYSATKLIFFPLLFICFFYLKKNFNLRQKIFIAFSIIFIFFTFYILNKYQNAAMYTGGQFFFQNVDEASVSVELERRSSNGPEFLENIFHNKITYWSRIFFINYLSAFSPEYLFLFQEKSGIYSIWSRGQLYLLDLPFLMFGLLYLFKYKKKEFILIIALLIISPLPSALGVSTPTYTQRSIFMLPWLYILIGCGVYYFFILLKSRNIKLAAGCLILIIYLFSFAKYLYQYYYDWRIYGSKYYSYPVKSASEYIARNKSNAGRIVFFGATQNTFLHYAFYNKLKIDEINKVLLGAPYKYENIVFGGTCPISLKEKYYKNDIYLTNSDCILKISNKKNIFTKDSKELVYRIYE